MNAANVGDPDFGPGIDLAGHLPHLLQIVEKRRIRFVFAPSIERTRYNFSGAVVAGIVLDDLLIREHQWAVSVKNRCVGFLTNRVLLRTR